LNKKTLKAVFIAMLLFSMLAGVEPAKSTSRVITVPDDYPTIKSAITNANDGDTIFVKKGVYVENPVVNKSVSLVGEDRDSTVIDVTTGLKVERDNVTITGFTIYDGWHGITVSANCCRISGNKITDATNGIVLFGCENNINGNILKSIGLSSAIQLNYANGNLINNNYIESCTEGIQLRAGSSGNTVTGNIVTNCKDVAIRLLGEYSPPRWYDPSSNTIMRNRISNSGCGTTVYCANRNIIINNNYVNNTAQFSANEDYYLIWGGNVSVNTIKENYWSDYNGTDANGDGIGDMPYVIDENNIDEYPLKKPVAIPAFPDPITPTADPSSTPSPEPQPEPFPTTLVVASVVTVAVIGLVMLVYFKKRKR
jgi:nitrous oxidase accessory protein